MSLNQVALSSTHLFWTSGSPEIRRMKWLTLAPETLWNLTVRAVLILIYIFYQSSQVVMNSVSWKKSFQKKLLSFNSTYPQWREIYTNPRSGKNDYVGPKFLKNGLDAYQVPPSSAPLRRGIQWYADNLPATYLAYGTGEVLLDYIRGFQEEMEQAGRDLTVFTGKDEAHIFNIMEKRYSKNRETWQNAMDSLVKWLLRNN